MKIVKIILAALCLQLSICASAYDFRFDGLCYNIISEEDRTVEVTHQIDNIPYNSNNYVKGEVIIPERFIYDGKTYKVTSIGDYAFFGCSSLTSVEIPNSVTSIGVEAFSGCSSLTSIEIPNSVTSIGVWAFSGCDGLIEIKVAEGNQNYVSIDGCLYSKGVTTLYYCPRVKTSITIPNSVTSIGSSAFEDCSGLTSVEIPNSVTSIGNYAFSGCSGLTSIEIPNSVTSIGNYAFEDCSGLTSVEIPNSVTSIGSSAFRYCRSLTSVEIPNSVTSIGVAAFSNCRSLTSVEIPNSVTSIGNYAFEDCFGLTSVEIPNSVTSIGNYAFSGCSGLTSVEIPNSVTKINPYTFSGCDGLTSLTLGSSVTSISSNAFRYCDGLKEVYCKMETPVETEETFKDEVYMNAVLYVPEGCKEAYEKVDPWRNFWTIEEFAPTGISGVTVNGGQFVTVDGSTIKVDNAGGQTVNVYTVGGQCVYSGTDSTISNLAKGVYVVKSGDNVAKIILK